jgi:hypothetical protein
MGITSTISSMATCTIRTAITATTTARLTSRERPMAGGLKRTFGSVARRR